MAEFTVSEKHLELIETEEDPDGADRGGYHQKTDTAGVDGTVLTLECQLSEYWEDRMGEDSEPDFRSKEDVLHSINHHLVDCLSKVEALKKLKEAVLQTTDVKVTMNGDPWPPPDDESEEDEADEESDDEDDE